MIRYRCDGCGLDLARNGSNHFILKIEAFAAAGQLEITQEDLARDHQADMRRLLDDLSKRSMDEIEDQVFRQLRFDLCPACHKTFLQFPLSGLKRP